LQQGTESFMGARPAGEYNDDDYDFLAAGGVFVLGAAT
jgi:hypothetical protein